MRDFSKAPDSRQLQPTHSTPPIPGENKIASIGSTQPVLSDTGKVKYFTVRERAHYPKAKVVAKCLYFRNNGQVQKCPYCAETASRGEDGFDGLRETHPSPGEAAKIGAQHVWALYSEDPVNPELYKMKKAEHQDRVEAYKDPKSSWAEKQHMLSLWAQQGLSDPRYPFPEPEILGFLSDNLRTVE